MHYQIECGDYPGELMSKVNDEIARGYAPVGGVSAVTTEYGKTYFCQALILENIQMAIKDKS